MKPKREYYLTRGKCFLILEVSASSLCRRRGPRMKLCKRSNEKPFSLAANVQEAILCKTISPIGTQNFRTWSKLFDPNNTGLQATTLLLYVLRATMQYRLST